MIDITQLPDGEPTGEFEYRFLECPWCGKYKHFYLNLQSGLSHCQKCKTSVPPKVLLDYLGITNNRVGVGVLLQLNAKVQAKFIKKRKEQDDTRDRIREGRIPDIWSHPVAREYLKERRVPFEEVNNSNLRFSPDGWAIQAPIHRPEWAHLFPSEEFFPAYTERSISEGAHGWRVHPPGVEKNRYVYGNPRPGQPIIIVEGVFDLLVPGWYKHGYATLGVEVSDELVYHLVKDFSKVLICYDNDVTGVKGRLKLQNKLEMWGQDVDIVDLKKFGPGFDPGQFDLTIPSHRVFLQRIKEKLHGRE